MNIKEAKEKYLKEALARPILKYSIQDRNGKILSQSNAQSVHIFTAPEDIEYALGYYDVAERFKNSNGDELISFRMKPSQSGLYRSADGNYYTKSKLPENKEDFISELYVNDVKVERNARISDTDDYIRIPDITVESQAKMKRTPLTEEERKELILYRQLLRDLPEQEGFPFVEWPEFPLALAYELQQKADVRTRNLRGVSC